MTELLKHYVTVEAVIELSCSCGWSENMGWSPDPVDLESVSSQHLHEVGADE